MIKIILISSFHTSKLRGETFPNFAIPFNRLNHYISNIEYRQTSMYSSTNSTKNILDEIHLPPSTYTEYIHQNMDNQQIFECQEIHQIPTISRQRVSERLLENRLRRIQIDFKREQQKENVMQRRREKEREISLTLKSKLASANKLKEVFLRESSSQQEKRRKGEEERERERLEKYRNNLEKIEKGREKMEEQKSAFVFRIQKKTVEKLREAKERKRLIHSTEEQENEEAHMEEWNQYKAKLMRKYEGQKKSPPDHLYQEFKEKNSWLQRIYSEMKQQSSQQTPETAKPHAEGRELKSQATVRAPKTSHRKAEYFGVHEADMLKKTVGDLAKMRQFVDQNTLHLNPLEDSRLMADFQTFLINQLL